jgi:hypothetical protein
MYSQHEIDEAVSAGAISANTADALRSHIEGQRAQPIQDEEQFRLITGFNDIFVAIAAAILLFAVGFIGQWVGERTGSALGGDGPSYLGPLLVAVTSWGLALFFTAKRRMALPSILLLLTFIGSVFVASATSIGLIVGTAIVEDNERAVSLIVAASAAIAAIGAWFHWKRFRVPITVAAGAAAVAGLAVALLASALGNIPGLKDIILGLILILGVGTFLFAMWWDSSDRARLTRRSDVAFWLHLLAAPMIVHPVFTLLGLNDGTATIGEGLVVILLYLVIGLTALAIDRRALLVSALAYVLYALNRLFEEFGAVELNVALTALIIGSALLMLSAFWHQARGMVVRPLPIGLRERLPLLDRPAPIPQPAA